MNPNKTPLRVLTLRVLFCLILVSGSGVFGQLPTLHISVGCRMEAPTQTEPTILSSRSMTLSVINAVKEQQAQIEAQRNEIAKLLAASAGLNTRL